VAMMPKNKPTMYLKHIG